MEEKVEVGEVMAKATDVVGIANEKVPPIYARRLPKIRGRGAAFLYTTERPAIRQPELRAEAAIDGTTDSFLAALGLALLATETRRALVANQMEKRGR
jgi:hypothetical protein